MPRAGGCFTPRSLCRAWRRRHAGGAAWDVLLPLPSGRFSLALHHTCPQGLCPPPTGPWVPSPAPFKRQAWLPPSNSCDAHAWPAASGVGLHLTVWSRLTRLPQAQGRAALRTRPCGPSSRCLPSACPQHQLPPVAQRAGTLPSGLLTTLVTWLSVTPHR